MVKPIMGAPDYHHPPDNGEMHYGAGLPGSACACIDKNRRETPHMAQVTCKACIAVKSRGVKR